MIIDIVQRLPGDWTLRVEHEGRALCELTFSVRLRYL